MVVKGVVTDAESSKPVEGAAIIIQGTTTGTISNQDGEYEIEIKEKGSVLVFSYVGYETQRVEVKKEVIDVAMKRANILLNFESGDKIMIRETSEKTLEGRQMEDVVVIVEEMPVFPGGFVGIQDYLTKNMKYPDDAKKNEIEGKVYIQFTVDEKGKVTNAKIVKSVYPSFDKETLRLIYNMPDWNPGKQRGKPVPVMFTMPVVFKQD